jgi:hypothetical protein
VRRLVTLDDRSREWPVTGIGNAWSREHYDGPFHVHEAPPGYPAISLVFVQTRDGNTGAANPEALGGGPTDKHLIYEGLSRVAADAVLAGAGSTGHSVFFTVHQPELVALRLALGLRRHPAQIGINGDLRAVFARLRHEHGIGRISAVGGSVTATSLVDAGLVQDIYLTTSAIEGGEPGTPWYVGERPPRLELIVRKREDTDVSPIVFEHFSIAR